mmetsp:Transcript_14249/g.27119  ORF Transcript_14249/g.27119 Transcript_14249/m.27119 type:complete len:84 (-) Transcript_14249:1466-1717(-)
MYVQKKHSSHAWPPILGTSLAALDHVTHERVRPDFIYLYPHQLPLQSFSITIEVNQFVVSAPPEGLLRVSWIHSLDKNLKLAS